MGYSDKQLKFLIELGRQVSDDIRWQDVTDMYNEEFGTTNTLNSLRKTFARHKDFDYDAPDVLTKNMISRLRATNENKKLKKEQKEILNSQLTFDEFLDEFTKVVSASNLKKHNIVVKKEKASKLKPRFVAEPIVCDGHLGLKTRNYNLDIATERYERFTKIFLVDLKKYQKYYTLDHIHLLLLGDNMQSATMHKDSGASCHLSNPEQIAACVEVLFFKVIKPIALTKKKLVITGVCGNHDKEDTKNFTVNPGRMYFTYTMYKCLEIMCQVAGFNNVTFNIPEDPYFVYEVFGSHYVAEHGNLVGKGTVCAMETMLIKRSAQENKLLSGIRMGNYHEDVCANNGRHIMNGSTVSEDHYAKGLGYKSRPCQLINYYVEDKTKDHSYHHSFPVDLS